ncbi:MAG: hypothetical protein F6K30_19550 [Cyanothece sp. SIO2G6]|nr:hypothetical protein [Cyanothece sp. SIO2G6]
MPSPTYETVRHMVFGSVTAVQNTIKLLYKLNYADPNDWSKPIPTGQPNEVMAVLTKKVRKGRRQKAEGRRQKAEGRR